MIVIGIDPGLTGAIAAVRDGKELLVLADLPTSVNGGGKVKRQIDAGALSEIVRNISDLAAGEYFIAVLEKTSAMPGQGGASMYSMGDSFGAIRGVLTATNIPLEYVTPTVWKRAMRLTSDKDASRSWASRLFPTASLIRKKDHDRAEAIALACYGYRTFA